jgi:hypothetical protein
VQRLSKQTGAGGPLHTTGNEKINAALKVLQKERERMAVKAEKDEDRDKIDDSVRVSSTYQDKDMADGTGGPQAPVDNVDNAFKILVHNATEEFGFVPMMFTTASSNFLG